MRRQRMKNRARPPYLRVVGERAGPLVDFDDFDEFDDEMDDRDGDDFYDGDLLDDVCDTDQILDEDDAPDPLWDVRFALLTQTVASGSLAQARRGAAMLAHEARSSGTGDLSHVVGTTLIDAVSACWQRGWQPADLAHVVGRNLKPPHRAMLADVVAIEAHPYVYASNAEPGWLEQTAAVIIGAKPPDRSGLLDHWGRSDGDLTEVLVAAIQLLDGLRRLPGQPRLCRPPSEWGTATSGGSRPSGGPSTARRSSQAPDPKVMQRVRALLAKAESTDFPEEAEAFTAKAQELIARHAIDQAMLEAGAESPALGTAARRVLIDDPYAKAKSLLLGQVVAANRCTAVWQPDLSLSTVFGLPNDIDAVELLYTSLLTQATAAMVGAGRLLGARGRERSFRQSFLVAFAARIGERLREANEAAVTEARQRHGDDVLPVLANRELAAEEARSEAFPRLQKQRISTSNYDGWIAGRAAADAARLGPDAAIGPRR